MTLTPKLPNKLVLQRGQGPEKSNRDAPSSNISCCHFPSAPAAAAPLLGAFATAAPCTLRREDRHEASGSAAAPHSATVIYLYRTWSARRPGDQSCPTQESQHRARVHAPSPSFKYYVTELSLARGVRRRELRASRLARKVSAVLCKRVTGRMHAAPPAVSLPHYAHSIRVLPN